MWTFCRQHFVMWLKSHSKGKVFRFPWLMRTKPSMWMIFWPLLGSKYQKMLKFCRWIVLKNPKYSFRLYLLGKNLNFSQLYPPVSYPVSRGTKMIAPLVRWKHTTSWPVAFTSKQETLLSSERTVSISLDDQEYSFLAGHEIDSTILFPGTGYLVNNAFWFEKIYF